MIIGFVLGMTKLTIEAVTTAQGIEEGLWADIAAFNFLYYSGVLLVISVIIVVGLSLLTEAPGEEKTKGITWGGLSAEDRAAIRSSWDSKDVIASGVVLAMVLGVYLYFSFWLG